jgi:D-aspartate ligase
MGTINATSGVGTAILERGRTYDWPPVVILNMFYTGLGIARQLSGKGIRVIGLSAEPKIYGNFTRLCEVRSAPNSRDDPKGLAEFLLRSTDLDGAVVFPTRDADVMFLDDFRSELQRKYCLAIPPVDCLHRTIDKHQLTSIARNVGIPVPRTLQLCSSQDLNRVANEVGFPCVLKPVSSFQWHLGDAWQRVGARKAIRIDDGESLQREYEQVSGATSEVLVQEWIPGDVDHLVVVGGYVDERSELVSHFTARKILQSPNDCGTGCIIRSEPLEEIVEPSRRLFRALQYQGIAEVEYKYDVRTGEHKLIEINTRHWDQHQLGEASGVNLSWIAYCHLTGRSLPEPKERVAFATWIAEDALLMRLIRSLVNPELRVAHLRAKLSGRRTYAIFATSDPLPFCRYFLGTMVPNLARKLFNHFGDYFLRS